MLADAASGGDVLLKFGLGGGADGHAGAVVEEEVERLDVVDGLAAHQGVDAAGVVADHAAEGAAAVGGGIGGEGELELLCGFADAVEHDAGLDVDGAGDGIDCAHLVHVLREVEDDGDVAALAGERGAASAREDGRVEAAADGDGGDDVVFVARDDETDGDVAVVGGSRWRRAALEAASKRTSPRIFARSCCSSSEAAGNCSWARACELGRRTKGGCSGRHECETCSPATASRNTFYVLARRRQGFSHLALLGACIRRHLEDGLCVGAVEAEVEGALAVFIGQRAGG